MGFSEELVKTTRKLLSSRTGDDNISDEQARESLRNITGFIRVLLDWHTSEAKPSPNDAGTKQADRKGPSEP